jgi:hypothetical protein
MIRRLILLFAIALLAACGNSERSDLKLLDETLDNYGATVRWGTPEQLVAFIDPEALEARPVRDFDLERLRQLRVASFRAQAPVTIDEKRVRQIAEVELVNINTQQVRSAVDRTEWRWDATAERWWLTSGLPDFAASR